MYQVNLNNSYFAAQDGKPLLYDSIGDTLRRAAEDSKDRPALLAYRTDGTINQSFTYGELYEKASDLALRLVAKYDKGTRLAICAPNIPQWVIFEYATALAGMTMVTLNPSYSATEMRYVIEQSNSAALYHVQSCRGNPIADIAKQVMSEVPSLKNLVDLEDDDAFYAVDAPAADALPDVGTMDNAQIQYTSGTTGFPKGAVLHHHGLINNSLLAGERLGMNESSSYMNIMPMFHTAGCGLGTLMPLVVRARIVLLEQFVPAVANEIIEKEKITCFFGVPTMLVGLLEELRETPRVHDTVDAILSGGSLVPPTLVKQTRAQWGCPAQVLYGQTESSPVVTQVWPDDSLEDLSETVGQALPHTDMAILDKDNNVVPIGEIGEICARGYCVMHHYNDNPEATAAAIDTDKWLHTGDLGTMDERGYIRVTGRIKEMIIRGGENVYPVEVENVMLPHPAIAEVAVVGIPSEKWGEEVACFMRWEDGASVPGVDELIQHALQKLSPQKKPRYWIAVENWPMTASGKIQKFALAEQYGEGLHTPMQD